MENFVNREAEMQLVEDKCKALLADNALIRMQIVEFYGVGGIGKTTILKKIEEQCQNMSLLSIWTDANQSIADFSREIIDQVRRYNVQFLPKSSDLLDQSISATRALLVQGPVVFLLDSLDSADEEQLAWIESMLKDLTEDNRLFAILASKRIMSFDHIMSIARRLVPFQLKPFDRDSYTDFLDGLEHRIEAEIRDIIFEWTNGYPLAVNVMIQAIHNDGLDPRIEQDQKRLLAIIVEQVISRGVLANVPQTPGDLEWYQTMLSMFSVPRRCNLSIMQKIVERFAPRYKLGSSLAYISLPKRINQTTDVLNWNPSKAGFSVEAPIRHIFLMKQKIEEHDNYTIMHSFLAATNRRLADEVSGTDRARYLQEYLYHSANCEDSTTLRQTIERTMQRIISEPAEYFLQFYEDFLNDEELKAVLGDSSNMVISAIYKRLALLNKQIASEVPASEKFIYLREFLYYVILNPIVQDIVATLQMSIREIVEVEPIDICARLHKELSQDARIREKLGENIAILSTLLTP